MAHFTTPKHLHDHPLLPLPIKLRIEHPLPNSKIKFARVTDDVVSRCSSKPSDGRLSATRVLISGIASDDTLHPHALETSSRLRAKQNGVRLDQRKRLHHTLRPGLVPHEVSTLQMRLVRSRTPIRLKKPDLVRMTFDRHGIQGQHSRLDSNRSLNLLSERDFIVL